MAGRIRSIKPELLDDEKTARLTHFEFRLFVALLLMADDYGNLRAQCGLIAAQCFWGCPASEEEVRVALDTLAELSLLRLYDVRGQTYAHVRGWAKHQRVDKPGKPRVPGPDEPDVREARTWKTYFVQLGLDGPIKIGKAIDVTKRVAKLQTAAPDKLHVLKVVEGDMEAAYHAKFESSRTHGEWFSKSQELMDFIKEEKFANDSRTIREPPAPDLRSPTSDLFLEPSAKARKFDLQKIADRYPRRKGIAPGLAKLKAVVKTQADYDAVLAGMERFCAEVRRKQTEIEFLPYFSTWVNAKAWEDGDDLPLPSVPGANRRDSEDLGDMAKRLGLE